MDDLLDESDYCNLNISHILDVFVRRNLEIGYL